MAFTNDNYVSHFVKYNRAIHQITQEELAEKAGVGLRFIRELERGKESLQMDKVNQVLAIFGYRVGAVSEKIMNPYEIMRNHFNRMVHIFLKDKTVAVGFIIDSIMESNEIKAWKFVSNNNSIEYQQTNDPKLLQTIEHADIESIENIGKNISL